MDLTITSYTGNVIPPVTLNSVPFAYPSGGNPGGAIVILPGQISAVGSGQGSGPVLAGQTIDLAQFAFNLTGGRTILGLGSFGAMSTPPPPPGYGAGFVNVTLQILNGANVLVQQYLAAQITQPVSMQGSGNTVAGPSTVYLRLINASYYVPIAPGPNLPAALNSLTGAVSAIEYL